MANIARVAHRASRHGRDKRRLPVTISPSSISCFSLTQSLLPASPADGRRHCQRRSVKATRPPIKTKHGHCLLTATTQIATVLIPIYTHDAFKPPKQPLTHVQIPYFIPPTMTELKRWHLLVVYSIPSLFQLRPYIN